MHILYHLVECVRELGPIWTFWAFPFENALGHLKVQNHGRKVVEGQLSFASNVSACLPMLLELCGGDEALAQSEEDQEV